MSRPSSTYSLPTRRYILTKFALGGTLALAGCQNGGGLMDSLAPGMRAACGTGIANTLGSVTSSVCNSFASVQITEAAEIQLGEGLYPRAIAASGGAYPNRRAQAALKRFAAPLFATSTRPNFQYEITLLNDDTVNAWSLPGGKIGVNKGLIRYCGGDDELAAVIGHEMGHAELSHVKLEMQDRQVFQNLGDVGKQQLQQTLDNKTGNNPVLSNVTGEVLTQLEGPIINIAMSGYSIDHEEQADQHILHMFGSTEHEPTHASIFFHTLLQIIPPGTTNRSSLYSTHPKTLERIHLIDQTATGMPHPDAPAHSGPFAILKQTFPTRNVFRRDYSENA